MPSNKAASVFGGAGGRGSRASVASLEGLRNVIRNDTTERDAPPQQSAAPVPAASAPPVAPVVPADNKQMLRGLNDRLLGFLDRVRQLQEDNADLEKQIDDILAKRKAPEGRNWEETQKPLEELKNQIKDITTENAKLLLLDDNTKMANEDFKNKLNIETKARKELEKDLEDLKRVIEDTKLNREQTQKEIDLVKDEIAHLEREHEREVAVLCEKIKDSEVTVEIESSDSNLAETLDSIRDQYEKLGMRNLKETDDWYKRKFDNIKVEEAQNVEAAQSGKNDLKRLLKEKQTVEIQIQSSLSTIRSLEDRLRINKVEFGQRLAPHNQLILDLEAELREVRAQVEQQAENNNNLLCVKMKLEAEINKYQQLMFGMTTDNESSEFAIEDAVCNGQQQKPGDTEEQDAPVKPTSAPTDMSTTPTNEAPGSMTADVNQEEAPKKWAVVTE